MSKQHTTSLDQGACVLEDDELDCVTGGNVALSGGPIVGAVVAIAYEGIYLAAKLMSVSMSETVFFSH